MTRNGNHTTYKNGDLGHCFTHIRFFSQWGRSGVRSRGRLSEVPGWEMGTAWGNCWAGLLKWVHQNHIDVYIYIASTTLTSCLIIPPSSLFKVSWTEVYAMFGQTHLESHPTKKSPIDQSTNLPRVNPRSGSCYTYHLVAYCHAHLFNAI